jgi:hypothetical protein
MQEETSPQELRDRLALIERMILEGRRSTESWGWTFVLWGAALYVAIAWANWWPSAVAWPVSMVSSFVLTLVIGQRKGMKHALTTIGRAVTYIWISVGISMLLIFTALGFSARIDEHSFVAVLGAMLGAANAASGLILRWKMQIACALVWWAVSVASCFGSRTQVLALFLAAIFFCQIVFGVHAMIREAQRSKPSGVAHA